MFEMKKFGAYLSRLRKERDLTQSMIVPLSIVEHAVIDGILDDDILDDIQKYWDENHMKYEYSRLNPANPENNDRSRVKL